jgi:hypothetical protein
MDLQVEESIYFRLLNHENIEILHTNMQGKPCDDCKLDDFETFYVLKHFQCSCTSRYNALTVLWFGTDIESLPEKFKFIINGF